MRGEEGSYKIWSVTGRIKKIREPPYLRGLFASGGIAWDVRGTDLHPCIRRKKGVVEKTIVRVINETGNRDRHPAGIPLNQCGPHAMTVAGQAGRDSYGDCGLNTFY